MSIRNFKNLNIFWNRGGGRIWPDIKKEFSPWIPKKHGFRGKASFACKDPYIKIEIEEPYNA
jgi:hypothetical protein